MVIASQELHPDIPFRTGYTDLRMFRDPKSPLLMAILVAVIIFVLVTEFALIGIYPWMAWLTLLSMIATPLGIWSTVKIFSREASKYGSEISLNQFFLEYERYEGLSDALFKIKRRIPLEMISSIMVDAPQDVAGRSVPYHNYENKAWKLTLFTFDRNMVELFRYPSILIPAANDVHNMRVRRGEGLGGAPRQAQNDVRSSIRPSTGNVGVAETPTEGIDATIENEMRLSSGASFLVGSVIFASIWASIAWDFSGNFYLGGFLIGYVLFLPFVAYFLTRYLDSSILSPREIHIRPGGFVLMRRRLKQRFVAWDDVAGMEDPEKFKHQYAVLLGKGRPIILSHDAARELREAYRSTIGHYPSKFVRGSFNDNSRKLRKAWRNNH